MMGFYDDGGLVNKKCARCGNGQMLMSIPHDLGLTNGYDCPRCGYSEGPYLARRG